MKLYVQGLKTAVLAISAPLPEDVQEIKCFITVSLLLSKAQDKFILLESHHLTVVQNGFLKLCRKEFSWPALHQPLLAPRITVRTPPKQGFLHQ